MSLRTSPQTGVAISQKEEKSYDYELKMFEISWGFPRQCEHWLGMTWFFDTLWAPRLGCPYLFPVCQFFFQFLNQSFQPSVLFFVFRCFGPFLILGIPHSGAQRMHMHFQDRRSGLTVSSGNIPVFSVLLSFHTQRAMRSRALFISFSM